MGVIALGSKAAMLAKSAGGVGTLVKGAGALGIAGLYCQSVNLKSYLLLKQPHAHLVVGHGSAWPRCNVRAERDSHYSFHFTSQFNTGRHGQG